MLLEKVKLLATELFDEIRDTRRHIHRFPELSFKEYETAAYIGRKLEEHQIPFIDKVAGTGLVANIEGKNPSSKTICLRADLDALPIFEKNDGPYKSEHEGIMHACGHDVHSSSMVGAAIILNKLKDEFNGTIKIIFQPGEEKSPGGASLIIKEGILDNPVPQCIIGQHVQPDLPVGKVGFRPGLYMASTDEIYITVHGKGGHGAMPHQLTDPVLIASHLIVALQQVVSRWSNPAMPTVLSFGRVIADGVTNVIPDKVEIEGTFRTFNEEWRNTCQARMKDMAKGLVESMGGKIDFDILTGYPFLKNDEKLTSHLTKAAELYMQPQHIVALELRPTAEDFAFYTHKVPGCFYRLGTGNIEKGITAPVHNPHFDIDENALITGMGLMTWMGLNALDL